MADHVHELRLKINQAGRIVAICTDANCSYWIETPRAEAMLNAAEKLSAEDAIEISSYAIPLFYVHKLEAYAKARGGE